MKKTIVCILTLISLFVCSFTAFKTTQKSGELLDLITDNPEALSSSNEGPGPQGRRQKQAVWCGGVGGWVVKEGCCYGEEECNFIYCKYNHYSCDGNTWVSL